MKGARHAKPFTAPARKGKEPKGTAYIGTGTHGHATCPVCGAFLTLKKAGQGDGPPIGTLVLSSHCIGGGKYNARRSTDIRCLGSGEKP